MTPAALAGLCALLASGRAPGPLPPDVTCPQPAVLQPVRIPPATTSFLRDALRAPSARNGIARVAFAEAANQGDSGLAAVVYAILNRLADGRWGLSVDAVLNARAQFEPVMRVGGDWRDLAPVSAAEQARIDTILNLALDGRLPDLTHGARFFQNSAIVSARARDGTVSARLVDFGGATPSAVIGAHRFYVDAGGRRPSRVAETTADTNTPPGIFVRSDPVSASEAPSASNLAGAGSAGDPSQALFVGADGLVRAGRP